MWGGKKEAPKLKLGTGSFGSLISSFMKKSASILNGKKVLIVDDEKDILDSLTELLSICRVETALSYEKAKELLDSKSYDVAILDIMGVRGYELLEIANNRNIPALMLTAHALSEEHLKQSARRGAAYYVPKDEISKIEVFIADVLDARQKKESPWERWLDRLGDFFNEKFGASDWRDNG